MDRDLSFLPFILASELLFVSEGILIFYKNKKTRHQGAAEGQRGLEKEGGGLALYLCHLPSKRREYFLSCEIGL